MFDHYDAIWNTMSDRDSEAREAGRLVGRYFREPIADGYAYYEVVEEDGEFVQLRHIAVGDAWTVPLIEHMKGRIAIDYVRENIEHRDRINAMFATRKAG